MLDSMWTIGLYLFIGLVSWALFAMINILFKEYWMNIIFYRNLPKIPRHKYTNLSDDVLLLGKQKVKEDTNERTVEL